MSLDQEAQKLIDAATYRVETRIDALEAQVNAALQQLDDRVSALEAGPPPEPVLAVPTAQDGLSYVPWGDSLAEPVTETQDPNFEGRIQRVSPDAPWRVIYPRIPAWNADESLLILREASGGAHLFDGQTYEHIRSLSGIASTRVIWSATDPNVAWTTWDGDNRLYRADPGGGTLTTFRKFSGYAGVNNGMGEGRPSLDDRYHALYVGSATVLVYDTETDTYDAVTLPSDDLDWVGMSPSGDYMVVRFGTKGSAAGQGVWAYDREGNVHRYLWAGSHGDVCQGADGSDMVVGVWDGHIKAMRIGDGTEFDVAFGAHVNGHVSGTSFQRPGYVTLSNHYASAGDPGWDQIVNVAVDGSMRTEVWCHARTNQTPVQYTYPLSTHATVSPSGTRVVWSGGWERSTTGESEARVYAVHA